MDCSKFYWIKRFINISYIKMNKIKKYIPLNCELGGVEFKTVFTKDAQNTGNLGKSSVVNGTIQIQEVSTGIEVLTTQQQNTYFHEIIHMMLDMIGESELSCNEKLVQNMGNMLFEFLRTANWIRIEELKHNSFSEPDKDAPFLNDSAIVNK